MRNKDLIDRVFLHRNNSARELSAFAGDAMHLNRVIHHHYSVAAMIDQVALCEVDEDHPEKYDADDEDGPIHINHIPRNNSRLFGPKLSPPGASKLAQRRLGCGKAQSLTREPLVASPSG